MNWDFFDHIWDPINKWADATFPCPRHPSGPINHLKKEIVELEQSDYKSHEEWADLMILVINGAHCAGLSCNDLFNAIVRKMAKNKKRVYNQVGADGVIEHDRSLD